MPARGMENVVSRRLMGRRLHFFSKLKLALANGWPRALVNYKTPVASYRVEYVPPPP